VYRVFKEETLFLILLFFLLVYFSHEVINFCPGLASGYNPLISASSKIIGITGMCHHSQIFVVVAVLRIELRALQTLPLEPHPESLLVIHLNLTLMTSVEFAGIFFCQKCNPFSNVEKDHL
jgi:hypothetical protein